MQGGAAGSRLSLVAGKTVGVSEVSASGTLHDVAADRGHVAQLTRRGEQQALRNDWTTLAYGRMCRHIAHSCKRAYTQAAVRPRGHVCHPRQRVDVEQMRRKCRPVLHEADEIRAAGDEGRVRIAAMRF